VALGTGMAGADYYVGWKNSSGGFTLSRRTATGEKMPTYSPSSQIAKIVPLAVPAPSWANLAFSFSRPIAADNTVAPTSPFIYGMGNEAPSSLDSPDSSFALHSERGQLPIVNFLSDKGGSATGSASNAIISSTLDQYKTIMLGHGILFFIAWFFAPMVAIFVARYMKASLGIWWYRLHWGLMFFVTGFFTLIGFLLVILYKKPPHFSDAHGQLGMFMVVATVFQIVLGFVINALWNPNRTSIPWWDKMHWWFGRLAFLLGIVNIYLGIQEYFERIALSDGTGLIITYWIIVVLGLLLLIFGQIKYGQTRKIIKKFIFSINSLIVSKI
jgi:hypothetical protein